jgi:hypothetical protein
MIMMLRETISNIWRGTAQVSTLLMTPICPHTSDHIWRAILKRQGSALTAGFPTFAQPDFTLRCASPKKQPWSSLSTSMRTDACSHPRLHCGHVSTCQRRLLRCISGSARLFTAFEITRKTQFARVTFMLWLSWACPLPLYKTIDHCFS